MTRDQTKWLIIGLAGACMPLLMAAAGLYFFFAQLNIDDSVTRAIPDGVEKVDGPAEWRKRANEWRAEREANKVERDRLEAKYKFYSEYQEIRRRLFHESDFDYADAKLPAMLSKISDAQAAQIYSDTITALSDFPYDAEPEKLREVMKKWTDARPDSHFAWLVRGSQAISYGYYWRGGGWGSTVTDEGWEHFREAMEEASECLQRAYELEPSDPEISYALMQVCRAQSNPRDEFETHFNRVLEIVPSHVRAHSEKFQYLRPAWSGSWPEFMEYLTSLDEKIRDPDLLLVRNARSYGLRMIQNEWEDYPDGLTQEQRDQARVAERLETWKAIAERWPEDLNVRANYLERLVYARNYKEAVREFDWIGDRYPPSIGWSIQEYHKRRVTTMMEYADDLDRAARQAEYDRIVALDPECWETFHLLGPRYIRQKDLDRAVAALERAIEIDPSKAGPYYTLANVYRNAERYEDALALLQKQKKLELKDFEVEQSKKLEAALRAQIKDKKNSN